MHEWTDTQRVLVNDTALQAQVLLGVFVLQQCVLQVQR